MIDSLLQIDDVFPDIAQVGYAFGQFSGEKSFSRFVYFFKISGNFSVKFFFPRELVFIIRPAGIYCIKMTGNTQSICIRGGPDSTTRRHISVAPPPPGDN